MILLAPTQYYKLTAPIQQVTLNYLFARSIIEHQVAGRVYADQEENPTTFYVCHPYGLCLLFGDCNNPVFNEAFRNYALNTTKSRQTPEWMIAAPDAWHPVLAALFKDSLVKLEDNPHDAQDVIELNARVNFRFNKTKYLDSILQNRPENPLIKTIPTDEYSYNAMKGNVVPAYFWKDAADFVKNGAGCSVYYNNELAATAYAAGIFDGQLELGIETQAAFRGKGLAYLACAGLIDYCLENELEPVWACRLSNTGSYRLALKLGFEPVQTFPFYRLIS
ncbi:GNAT family N-acetyltransferase [Chitinophaga nivalis]|uniref:GNAT family N-acetyltransferase n=1 Tax=Chitinophaga nivalis TaxID=2991709 RepID=A0ABT3IGZ3_9BACT|nr:GNAT family N-acetyltransferase [Chitinophaga nivalis]MCW3467084.1 GNAT family N-acetyltransferase [Chitinophaga nivalis]MCW3483225.1 GNAT family N-acetyltransferase [Chitinophaga nivalis]